jgi:hypothetical protein
VSASKHDSGKQQWHLILTFLPPDALHEVARVMEFGAAKYAFDNWSQGMDWSRYLDAAVRHLVAFWKAKLTGGNECDHESGLHHLAHAACDVLFLLAYVLRGIKSDNRPTLAEPKGKPAEITPAPVVNAVQIVPKDWWNQPPHRPG